MLCTFLCRRNFS